MLGLRVGVSELIERLTELDHLIGQDHVVDVCPVEIVGKGAALVALGGLDLLQLVLVGKGLNASGCGE